MTRQEQFLDVVDRDVAEARFRAAISCRPTVVEVVALDELLGRVLARDIVSPGDTPGFDRSNVDGFAVVAADTIGASELTPRTVRLVPAPIDAGTEPSLTLRPGWAVSIATGGMMPRGADAVVMVEHADTESTDPDGSLIIRRAVAPGHAISFAGSDVARSETLLRAGTMLTSRETGVLAAVGIDQAEVWRKPRVAIISTGNELVPPGAAIRPAQVFDSNSQIVADAVRELGGEPLKLGIVHDDLNALRAKLREALATADVVLLSGGTSKGQGDLCYRAVAELNDPGIVAHGVALKPGKPLCLASSGGKPVVILPGFPTSAIFTFHEFVAPVIRALAGHASPKPQTVSAQLPVKVVSEVGRTEYLLVGLIPAYKGLIALPMGKGSGSVTTFSRADGFITIPRHRELIEAGETVSVELIGRDLALADLVVVGSHCVGLDVLLSKVGYASSVSKVGYASSVSEIGYASSVAEVRTHGIQTKLLTVGSTAGLAAAKQGHCDIAPIHLLDAATGQYNAPFVPDDCVLVKGYRRRQGIVFRPGDTRFVGKSPGEIVATAAESPECVMVNRNQGSGTRILIDQLLHGRRPTGYAAQPTSHNAVAAAVAQGRADWGMTIETVATAAGLVFVPYQDEEYDFVVPRARIERPAVKAFLAALEDPEVRDKLSQLRLNEPKETPL